MHPTYFVDLFDVLGFGLTGPFAQGLNNSTAIPLIQKSGIEALGSSLPTRQDRAPPLTGARADMKALRRHEWA